MAFIQTTYAVQIEWTAMVPENSLAGWGSIVSTDEGGFLLSTDLPAYTAFTTSIALLTDDVTGTLSFKSVSLAMPIGTSVSSGRTIEIPPSGFGQPAISYTVNMTFDSFAFSVTSLTNSNPLIYTSGTDYYLSSDTVQCLLETFTLGGNYSVISGGETVASDVFSLSPTSLDDPTLSNLWYGGIYADINMAGYPNTILLRSHDLLALSLNLDFDDTPFANNTVIINGTVVTLPEFTGISMALPTEIVLSATPIPEPSTITLFAGIAVCFLVFLKRKHFHS